MLGPEDSSEIQIISIYGTLGSHMAMEQGFRCQMNNKFEGWAPSDFKHLWSEHHPEPRHATVLKTSIVTDHSLALHKVHLFGWEQVCQWLCESSLIISQMDTHPPSFLVNPWKQSHNFLTSQRNLWFVIGRMNFTFPLLQDSLYLKIKRTEALWKYAPGTPPAFGILTTTRCWMHIWAEEPASQREKETGNRPRGTIS